MIAIAPSVELAKTIFERDLPVPRVVRRSLLLSPST